MCGFSNIELYLVLLLCAVFVQVYFGCGAARYHLAFHSLGISCFTGMSYLIKKQELDSLNGLSWFGRFLAEDFFIAKHLHEKYGHQKLRFTRFIISLKFTS